MDLNVVYSCDNLYAQHTGVSMLSLFENNKEFNSINIFIIGNNISKDNQAKLIYICKEYNRAIQFINFNTIAERLRLNIGNSIAINSYARLFLSSVLDETIDKVIYFDCDSVINNSLSELWSIDIRKYFVAGVCDTVGDITKTKIKMDPKSPYINAGMLLINLKKWREENIEDRFLDFIDSFKGNVYHHDQGTINGVLSENLLIIHPKYNSMTTFFTMSREEIIEYYKLNTYYYSDKEIKEAVEDPVFIHYTPAFANRPWVKGSIHPQVQIYRNYLEKSPWKGTNLWEDKRSKGEKIVALLYNYLPFKMAHRISNLVFR